MFYLGTRKEVFAKIFDEEPEHDESAKKQNKLRRKLHSFFKSISVSTFPIPSQNPGDLDCNAPSTKFQECVELLKNEILCHMSQPRKFGKTLVNSQSVDSLTHKFVQNLESGDIVHVKSAVSQYQREEIEKAKRDFEKGLKEAYEKIGLPVDEDEVVLDDQLTQKRDHLLETFQNSTANIDLEDVYKTEVFQNLIQFAELEIYAKKLENQAVIRGMLKINRIILNERYYIGHLLRSQASTPSPARVQVGIKRASRGTG